MFKKGNNQVRLRENEEKSESINTLGEEDLNDFT